MAALAKVESLYQEDLSKLIRCLTGFEDDDENSEICYKYAMSHLLFNNYPSANKWGVNRKLDGIVEKLQFHGLPGKAEKLKLLVKKFICLKEAYKYEQVDLEWQILQLLLCLAYRPSDAKTDIFIDEKELAEPFDSKLLEKKKKEEWAKYLREDDEKFNYTYDDDKSDWSALESEEEEEVPITPKKVVDEPSHASQFHWPLLFPKSEPVAKFKNRKEYMRSKMEQSLTAENHLKLEVQHSWWNIDEEISKMGEQHSLGFMDLATSWRPSEDGKLLMVLSEKKILREVLWTLHCPTSSALFELNESGSLTVRNNFTLASASQKSTIETVTRLSGLLQICQEMSSFRESLDFFTSSFTLQVYANTLAEVLEPFMMEVISLEKQLNQQDSIVTLLNLEEVIAPYYLDLKYVYQIHLNATSKHDSQPMWMATSRLLSELEIGLLEATSLRQTDIMLRLFINSLRVSLDIIDRWLSTGQLEDFRNEFLIARSDEDRNSEVTVLDSFVVKRTRTDSRILNCLAFSALKAARSMEFALKMSDAHSIFLNTSESGLMYEEFLSKLGQAITEVFNISEEDSRKEMQPVVSSLSIQESAQGDMQYYKDLCRYHPLTFNVIEKLQADVNERSRECNESQAINGSSDVQSSYDKYIPELPDGICVYPLNQKIESLLESLITLKHDPAASQLKQYLITHASLLIHLEVLHKVYLLESGHTLVRFYNKMFTLAEADLWKGAKSLSPLLEDCIEKDIGEFCERFEVTPKESPSTEKFHKKFKISKTLKSIDNIYIHYEVESPINIVISEEALNSYNFVFHFLSKIKWAQWSLQQLNVKDLSKIESDPKTRRLLYLRFFLLNSVSQIHHHFVRQISGDLLETLKKEIIDAVSLDAVLEAHKSYLKKLINHCLSDDIVLKRGLFPYLSMCKSLKSLWKKQMEGSLVKEKLTEFEKHFVKTHWHLTLSVETAINLTSSKYSGPLAELWKVLSTNIPILCDSSSGDVISHLP